MPHDYFALVVAIVGASIMPWMLFYQQSASVDKKLTREDLKGSRVETLVGAFASQALMAAIVIAAAAAMESARAGAASAEPLRAARRAGSPGYGRDGLAHRHRSLGSGLLAWSWCRFRPRGASGELMGWPHSLNLKPSQARRFYAVYFAEVLPAAVVALASADLVRLCIEAMVFNVVVLALPLAFLVRLTERPRAARRSRQLPRHSAVLWLLTAALLLAGVFGCSSTWPEPLRRRSAGASRRGPVPRLARWAPSRPGDSGLARRAAPETLPIADDRWTRSGTGSSAQGSLPGITLRRDCGRAGTPWIAPVL